MKDIEKQSEKKRRSPAKPGDGRLGRTAGTHRELVKVMGELLSKTGKMPQAKEVADAAGCALRTLFYHTNLEKLRAEAVMDDQVALEMGVMVAKNMKLKAPPGLSAVNGKQGMMFTLWWESLLRTLAREYPLVS